MRARDRFGSLSCLDSDLASVISNGAQVDTEAEVPPKTAGPLSRFYQVPVNSSFQGGVFREGTVVESEEGSHRMKHGIIRARCGAVGPAVCEEKLCLPKRIQRADPFAVRVFCRHATTPSAFAFRYRGYFAASYAATSTGNALIGRSSSRTRS